MKKACFQCTPNIRLVCIYTRYDSGCPDDEDTKKTDDITSDGRRRRPAQFTDNLPFSEDGQIEENLVYADSDDDDDENIQFFSKSVHKETESSKIMSNENESGSSDEDEESGEEEDDENDNEMMSEEDKNSDIDSEDDDETDESDEVSDETDGDSDSEMESEVEETKLLKKSKNLAKNNACNLVTGKDLSLSDKKLTSDIKTQAVKPCEDATKLSNNVNKSSLSEGFDSDNSGDSSNDMEVDSKISKTSDSIQTFLSSGDDSDSENSEEELDDDSNEEDDDDNDDEIDNDEENEDEDEAGIELITV
ncbi:unnamed protein product [Mytilus coruscus]|uniref:Uncharacterized protein n=1 Tax=Mytilus coruscus TaxID=42192 RepID=A0A6J8CM63_MYTCO|nr:unnamed protein product [Mytilus coruscus]